MWLGTLLLNRSEDIYRMKGLLSVQGMDERFVFQVRCSSCMSSSAKASFLLLF